MKDDKYCYYYEDESGIPKIKGRKIGAKAVILLALGVFVFGLISLYAGIIIGQKSKKNVVVVYEQANSHPLPLIDNNSSVESVVLFTGDSVVEIVTDKTFCDENLPSYISSNAGSGVIWTENGYVVTSYNVVRDAGEIEVVLPEQGRYPAHLEYFDTVTDLAILKIAKDGLTPVLIGNSSSLQKGQEVVAMGSPFKDSEVAVTNGIISSTANKISLGGSSLDLLCTSFQLSAGYIGGGIFNFRGELVGIVSGREQEGKTPIGFFATPSDTAKVVVQNLLENGYVKGRVDCGIIQLNEFKDTGGPLKPGLRVARDYTGTNIPLTIGDYIVSVDGQKVTTKKEWQEKLSNCNVGDSVVIVYERKVKNKVETKEFVLALKEKGE